MNQGVQKELLEKLEEKLKESYDKETINELLNLIYKTSIIVCTQRNKGERIRLLDEKEWDEKELARLSDKVALVEELTKTKKKKAAEIKKLDKIISSDHLLLEEFDKRNSKLSEYKKIFSPENLLGTLKKERKKALNEIEECNRLLDAKYYVNKKNGIEKELELLKDIEKPDTKEKHKIKMQKLFIKCIQEKIDKITTIEQKKQAASILRVIRYYNFILFNEENFICQIEKLKEPLDNLEKQILFKLFEIKGINQITKDLQTDLEIIKPIFKTRVMSLENAVFHIKNENNEIQVRVFDGDTLESEYTIDNINCVKFKGTKKIKLFTK